MFVSYQPDARTKCPVLELCNAPALSSASLMSVRLYVQLQTFDEASAAFCFFFLFVKGSAICARIRMETTFACLFNAILNSFFYREREREIN